MRLENKSVPQLERTLWELCKNIIRAFYPNVCFTCDAYNLEGSNNHTGHYYPKGALGASMKYDLRILRPQCYRCNIFFGGMGAVFRERMKEQIGVKQEQALYDECAASKGHPIKSRDHYLKLIPEYERIYKKLSTGRA